MEVISDEEVLSKNSSSLTILQIKSFLSSKGVELSTQKEKRDYYVNLLEDWKASVNAKRKRDSESQSTESGKTKKLKDSSTNKPTKRKSTIRDPAFRPSKDSGDEEEEDDSEAPKKKEKSSSTPLTTKRPTTKKSESVESDIIAKPLEKVAKKERRQSLNVFQQNPSDSDEEKSVKEKRAPRRKTIASSSTTKNNSHADQDDKSKSSLTSHILNPSSSSSSNGKKISPREQIILLDEDVTFSPSLSFASLDDFGSGQSNNNNHNVSNNNNNNSNHHDSSNSNRDGSRESSSNNNNNQQDNSDDESRPTNRFWSEHFMNVAMLLTWILFMSVIIQFWMSWPVFCTGESFEVEGMNCLPCPPHGECVNGTLICDVGYVRSGYRCVSDPLVDDLIHSLANGIFDYLKELNGRYQCRLADKKVASTSEIREALKTKRLVPEAQLDTLFEKAIDYALENPEEYPIKVSSLHSFSTDQATYPPYCRFRLFLAHNILSILGAFVVSLVVLWILRQRRKKKEEEQEVQQLVGYVNELLQTQKVLSQTPDSGSAEPYFSSIHMRDYIFRPPFNQLERDRKWAKVKEVISRDSRIQAQVRMVHGEQHTTWEWVAPVLDKTPRSRVALEFTGPAIDEGSSTAVDRRYPGVFPQRSFR